MLGGWSSASIVLQKPLGQVRGTSFVKTIIFEAI